MSDSLRYYSDGDSDWGQGCLSCCTNPMEVIHTELCHSYHEMQPGLNLKHDGMLTQANPPSLSFPTWSGSRMY